MTQLLLYFLMAGLMNFSPLSRQNLEKFSLGGNSSFGQNLVLPQIRRLMTVTL
jgi:hypothetical protein